MKYPDFAAKTNELLQDIESRSSMFEPKNTVKLLKDENDNRFLELAQASNSGFLITGNTKHFTMEKFHNTLIVSPREYWENFKPF